MANKKVGVHGTDEERAGKAREGNGGGGNKTKCPISLKKFNEVAKPLQLTVEAKGMDPKHLTADLFEFSSGNFGWRNGDRMQITLPDGTKVTAIVGLNITIVGSKDAPRE